MYVYAERYAYFFANQHSSGYRNRTSVRQEKKSQKAFIARDETFQNLPLMAKISLTIQLMQTISLAIKLEKFLIFFLTFFHWFCTPFT